MTTTFRARSGGRPVWRLLVATVFVGVVAACSSGRPPGLPASFPADFPLPSGAIVASSGDAFAFHLQDTTPDDLETFYREHLPRRGWTVVDTWDGVDPHGQTTSGLIIEQGSATGALAFTAVDDGAAILRVNLSQPATGTRTP